MELWKQEHHHENGTLEARTPSWKWNFGSKTTIMKMELWKQDHCQENRSKITIIIEHLEQYHHRKIKTRTFEARSLSQEMELLKHSPRSLCSVQSLRFFLMGFMYLPGKSLWQDCKVSSLQRESTFVFPVKLFAKRALYRGNPLLSSL